MLNISICSSETACLALDLHVCELQLVLLPIAQVQVSPSRLRVVPLVLSDTSCPVSRPPSLGAALGRPPRVHSVPEPAPQYPPTQRALPPLSLARRH
eukprot:455502-Rhodomonas_salina.1